MTTRSKNIKSNAEGKENKTSKLLLKKYIVFHIVFTILKYMFFTFQK